MYLRQFIASVAGGIAIALGAGSMSRLQAQGTATDVRADSQFIRDVASTNLLEIQLGKVAQKKATNAAVKDFAQRMVVDHTQLELKWANTVSKNGLPFQPGLTAVQQEEASRLQALAGPEFDRIYMTSMIQGHETAVGSLQSGAQTAHSTVVRDLATSALPTVQEHLILARQVGGQVGVSVATTTPNPPVSNPGGQPSGQAPAPAAQPSTGVRADSGLIREFAADNLQEVRLGQMAQSKATNPAVKRYAQQMITDHISLQNQWYGLASSNGVALTQAQDSTRQLELERLQRLSGNEFDRSYMSDEIQSQETAVSNLRGAAGTARSSQVRNLIATSLPTVQQHLSTAWQVGSQVGATSVATTPPNGPVTNQKADVVADSQYIRNQIAANLLEVRLGRLAANRAQDPVARKLGQRLAADHTRLQNEWIDMASRNGMKLEAVMGKLHWQKVERLEKESGKGFDRVFLTTILEHHRGFLPYLHKEGRSAHSAPVRQLVENDIPAWQQDRTLARHAGKQMGIDVDNNGRVSIKN